jgi:hypothetical protein
MFPQINSPNLFSSMWPQMKRFHLDVG